VEIGTMIHKYKGYHIQFQEIGAHEDKPAQKFFKATDSFLQTEIIGIQEQRIQRPFHGNECECEICTYTEEDHAFNRKIEEKAQQLIWKKKNTTFQEKTLKACKQKIDELRRKNKEQYDTT
tara:strand:+ start:162 stop:524 length:363 start_codon:yes stop_codon:yes gene_type:complete